MPATEHTSFMLYRQWGTVVKDNPNVRIEGNVFLERIARPETVCFLTKRYDGMTPSNLYMSA